MNKCKPADPIDVMAWEIIGLLDVPCTEKQWLDLRELLADRLEMAKNSNARMKSSKAAMSALNK